MGRQAKFSVQHIQADSTGRMIACSGQLDLDRKPVQRPSEHQSLPDALKMGIKLRQSLRAMGFLTQLGQSHVTPACGTRNNT